MQDLGLPPPKLVLPVEAACTSHRWSLKQILTMSKGSLPPSQGAVLSP